jgi:hypothetical protein
VRIWSDYKMEITRRKTVFGKHTRANRYSKCTPIGMVLPKCEIGTQPSSLSISAAFFSALIHILNARDYSALH